MGTFEVDYGARTMRSYDLLAAEFASSFDDIRRDYTQQDNQVVIYARVPMTYDSTHHRPFRSAARIDPS